MTANVETMMYVGETPWHKLGTKLDGLATAKQAIEAAGLDWEVEVVPVYVGDDGVLNMVNDYKAVRRVSDKKLYTIKGTRFVPVQNRDAFNFFDDVIGTGEALYSTAGSLAEGARIWIMAKMSESLQIAKDDIVEEYIVLSNSHDGSSALKMFWTPVRVVCQNTLNMAESTATNKFYSRHTTNVKNRLNSAREILGMTKKYYQNFGEQARVLVSQQMSVAGIPLLLQAAFVPEVKLLTPGNPMKIAMEDMFSTHAKSEMAMVTRLFDGEGTGVSAPDVKGTKWAMYNAVTEYVDHYRNTGKNEDSRLQSIWFGSGEDIKTRAFNYLIKN